MVIFWEGCACTYTVKTFDSRLIFNVMLKRLTVVMTKTNGILAKRNAMVHNNRSIECLQLFCVDLVFTCESGNAVPLPDLFCFTLHYADSL